MFIKCGKLNTILSKRIKTKIIETPNYHSILRH